MHNATPPLEPRPLEPRPRPHRRVRRWAIQAKLRKKNQWIVRSVLIIITIITLVVMFTF